MKDNSNKKTVLNKEKEIELQTFVQNDKPIDYGAKIKQDFNYAIKNHITNFNSNKPIISLVAPTLQDITLKKDPIVIKSINNKPVNSRPILNIDSHISYQNIYNHYSNFDETQNLKAVVVNVGYFDDEEYIYKTFNSTMPNPNVAIQEARKRIEKEKAEYELEQEKVLKR